MASWGLFASNECNETGGAGEDQGTEDFEAELGGDGGEDGIVSFEELLAQAEAEPPLERLPLLAAVLLKMGLPPMDDIDATEGLTSEEIPSTPKAAVDVLNTYAPVELVDSRYFPAILKGLLLHRKECEESVLRLLAAAHHASILGDTSFQAATATATIMAIATASVAPELECGAGSSVSAHSSAMAASWLALADHAVGALLSRTATHILSGSSAAWHFTLLSVLSKRLFMTCPGVTPLPAYLPLLLIPAKFRRQAIRYLLQGCYLHRLLMLLPATSTQAPSVAPALPGSASAASSDNKGGHADGSVGAIASTVVELLERTTDGRAAIAHARADLGLDKGSAASLKPRKYRVCRPDRSKPAVPLFSEANGSSVAVAACSCSCACCISQDDGNLWSLTEEASIVDGSSATSASDGKGKEEPSSPATLDELRDILSRASLFEDDHDNETMVVEGYAVC